MVNNPPFLAHIRPGVNASVNAINTREGPGTNHPVPFTVATGTSNLRVLAVEPDENNTRHNGKRYQWFQVQFPDNQEAWVRDDLINVSGDGSRFGYGIIAGIAYAFELTRAEPGLDRTEPVQPPPSSIRSGQRADTDPPDARIDPPQPPQPPASNQERIIKAAFNITAAFEGSGYAAYQNFDKGIVSYGRFQFTLLSGNLTTVIQRYVDASSDEIARLLRDEYLPRLLQRDETLRNDTRLRDLLLAAAEQPEMQQAQDAVALERFWQRMFDLSIVPRNIQTPLAQAFFFDISIQHGTHHNIFVEAEQALGVPIRSRVGENGVAEEVFVHRAALVRSQILGRIAEARNLPGVRRRAEFWENIIQTGDWQLQGDEAGTINVLGKQVQVRNP